MTSQFLFKFCIIFHCHDTKLLCKFSAHKFILSTKGAYQNKILVKFYVSSRKSEILHSNGLFLPKSCTVSAKKSTEELSLMTQKSDAKFKEKLTCSFKHDIRNLVNFYPTIQKSENCFLSKVKSCELKNRDELSLMTLNSDAKFE